MQEIIGPAAGGAAVRASGDQDIAGQRSDTTSRRPPPITRAAWGHRAADEPEIRLVEFKPIRRNTLHGFCVIELPSGLVIRDVSIHEKAGKCWASLPAKPVLDVDGRHISNHAGHKQYAAVLSWRSRELADRWSAAVVDLVREQHPDALDGDSP